MSQRWTSQLTRYHWFVLIVAALGWLFDTMDQQLFNLARMPAMRDLVTAAPGEVVKSGDVVSWGTFATSIFLIGWATGGLCFGMLGDRIGRAKTMMLTILLYSACTGLSAFSRSVWDFSIYRFLTGLGVGGEFAVGVALVAETMPASVRAHALGLLQALSAVGNICAALISLFIGNLEQTGVLQDISLGGVQLTAWRCMFLVGALPALLALIIRRNLREPEQWKEAAASADNKPMGSYAELFGDPRWRRNAIVGMLLALTGVIGLWGIGFFSIDLQRSVFRKTFEADARELKLTDHDRDLLRAAIADPAAAEALGRLTVDDFINANPDMGDAAAIGAAVLHLKQSKSPIDRNAVLEALDAQGQSAEQRTWREEYLSGEPTNTDAAALAGQVAARSADIGGRTTWWVSIASVLLNVGGFLGMYCVSHVAERIGRKPTFAISYVLAGLSTALVFSSLDDLSDIWWMMPLMGGCILSLFGGYAIYLPELFPTRLRSTGTSFCYNVGRFLAAAGPVALGYLTSQVFVDHPEPMRPAGLVMCSIFLLGLLVLPFAPETRGKPLPE